MVTERNISILTQAQGGGSPSDRLSTPTRWLVLLTPLKIFHLKTKHPHHQSLAPQIRSNSLASAPSAGPQLPRLTPDTRRRILAPMALFPMREIIEPLTMEQATSYEIAGSPLCRWCLTNRMRDLAARYFVWKARRKLARWQHIHAHIKKLERDYLITGKQP